VPIYEYECNKCGDSFELIQGFSDKALKKCRKCGGRLHKLISECSFQLKGTGWYVTDYGKSGKSKSATATASTDKKDADTKKEKSKSASKTDSSSSSSSSSSADKKT
jgi:putative FmdB family regulatory protein